MAYLYLFRGICLTIFAVVHFTPLIQAGSCGLYGSLRHPDLIERFNVPSSNKITLVSTCEKACIESKERCLGFAVNLDSQNCQLFRRIMEEQGMAQWDEFSTMHYDMTCFDDTPISSSTQVALNLPNSNDAYTCVPSGMQGIYNPSFEDGLFVRYAHGWSLHGSTEENKPARYAGGVAKKGDTNMIFDVAGAGTSSVSQTLCVVPALQYELTAYIGHLSHNGPPSDEQPLHYHAPTVRVFLDQDLIYRSSICGPYSHMHVTECQLKDGTYYPISVTIQPRRSTPNLTFEYSFDAPEGRSSYKGLLDVVQLYTSEPPI